MVKPTRTQLQKLYVGVDTDYISDHIDRKLILIKAEDSIINDIETVMRQLQMQVIGILFMPISDDQKAKLLKAKFLDIDVKLVGMEVDAIIQLYESSGFLYKWLLEKYFGSVEQKAHEEVGGEQDTQFSVSRKTLKKHIQSLINKTITRRQNIAGSVDEALNTLMSDINRMSGDNMNMSDLNRAFGNARRKITHATRSILQQSVYDAETKTMINVSDEYQIVYYRVEVLDSSICMNCMYVDGSINEKPLGLLHKNCRGIDVVLLRDVETGKYYDTNRNGYGHKLKTKTFEQKFNDLSALQKRKMLGKSNYELYVTGKLKPNDFLSYGRQITNAEAKLKVELNGLKKTINNLQKVNAISKYIDNLFSVPISKMSKSELLAYEKCLGLKVQLYKNIPKKAYPKSKPLQSYIDDIDAKYDEINKARQKLK